MLELMLGVLILGLARAGRHLKDRIRALELSRPTRAELLAAIAALRADDQVRP